MHAQNLSEQKVNQCFLQRKRGAANCLLPFRRPAQRSPLKGAGFLDRVEPLNRKSASHLHQQSKEKGTLQAWAARLGAVRDPLSGL